MLKSEMGLEKCNDFTMVHILYHIQTNNNNSHIKKREREENQPIINGSYRSKDILTGEEILVYTS